MLGFRVPLRAPNFVSTPCWAGRCLWKSAHLPCWRGIIRISLGSWGICACVPWSRTPVKPCRQVTLRRLGSACRSYYTVGLHVFESLGAQSHSPHAPCLRFAAEVTLVPRKTRLRLATTLFRAGFSPARSHSKVSVSASSHDILLRQASWRTISHSKGVSVQGIGENGRASGVFRCLGTAWRKKRVGARGAFGAKRCEFLKKGEAWPCKAGSCCKNF